MVNQYPEQVPTDLKPIDSFKFQISSVSQVQEDNRMAVEALEIRLKKLTEKLGTIKDIPILTYILQISHDRTELKNLAKGLDRVAEFIGDLDQAKDKQSVLDLVEKDPLWFYWAFGGFKSEIDDFEATINIIPPIESTTSEE